MLKLFSYTGVICKLCLEISLYLYYFLNFLKLIKNAAFDCIYHLKDNNEAGLNQQNNIEDFVWKDLQIIGYKSYPRIPAPMAV